MERFLQTTPVYDSYWSFAAERLAIYMRRLAGQRGPWTDDPILNSYRFTNTFRAADRVSQYLIAEVQYHPERSPAPCEIFFRTMLFKLFNKIETWELLEASLGPISWEGLNFDRLLKTLNEASRTRTLYSAAYIMPSPDLGSQKKHSNHIALLRNMMTDGVPKAIQQASSLRQVYDLLLSYPGIGPFLAFQFAIDLNYSTLLELSEADFVVAGPGALDGISKCFLDAGGRTPEQLIYLMVERQDEEFAERNIHFPGLFGRKLQPIDCQNLFCEISKYARVAHPEILGSAGRTRIKQGYKQSSRHIPPPVWRN